ncbi:hypothetical protein ACN27G_31765 [Plantactinospora sp. WMMB334]
MNASFNSHRMLVWTAPVALALTALAPALPAQATATTRSSHHRPLLR